MVMLFYSPSNASSFEPVNLLNHGDDAGKVSMENVFSTARLYFISRIRSCSYYVNMNYLHKINSLFMAGFCSCGEFNSAEHGQ